MDQISIDHKALVANLTDDQRLSLTEKSDRAGLLMLSSHVLGLLLTGAWITAGSAFWQVALVLHGIQLVFLFTLLHETAHNTPFASLALNTWVGRLCGFILFLPAEWFRYYHLAHHRHTHNPERDPELAGPPIDTMARYVLVVSGLPIWKFHFTTLFETAFGRVDHDYLPTSVRPRAVFEARFMLAFYMVLLGLSFYFATAALFYVWIVPMALGQPFLRLYLLAEHGRCPHVANMLENSRTTYTNALVRWLAWNMPYHSEHHAYPTVPFHKLPAFHEVAKKHLKSTENGYTAFNKKKISSLMGEKRREQVL